MSAIDLLLDEENELTFQINIEGNSPGTAKCRLKLDNPELGLLFEANSQQDGEISVVLPPLTHVLKEGTYDMILEVVVDDKFFEPLSLKGNFEKSIKVTAESVVRKPKRRQTKVSASVVREESKPVITVRNSRTETSPSVINENKKQKRTLNDKDILKLIEALRSN